MAATGKTPILLYGSTTPTNAPTAGNLTNSSDGCEIAINVADKNLFFKDSTNAVNTVPIRQSSGSSDGWLSSANWTTFNSKQAALVSGTNIKTVSGTTLLGSGDLGTIGTGYGGTGLTSFTANGVVYASSTSALATSSGFTFDGANLVIDKLPGAISYTLKGGGYGTLAAMGVVNVNVDNTSYVGSISNNDFLIKSYNNTVATAKTTGDFSIATGNLVIGTSGKGIDFSATAGTGTSELLADYEEGTFTPAIVGTTTSGTGTYSVQVGRYTKIGNRVMFNLFLTWSAHTGTGNMNISGLPYTSNSTTNNITSLSVWSTGINFSASSYPQFYLANNTTTISMAQTIVGTSANNPVTLDTAGSLLVSGQYEV